MRKKIIFLFLSLLIIMPSLQAAQGSVILIHGFLRSYRSMLPMGKSLQKCGFKVCLWDYPSRRYTIRQHAAHLVALLQQKAAECPGEPIHFVCHSLGSLVLRTALNMPDCPNEAKIGMAALLAPPNRGSRLGRSARDNIIARWAVGSKSGWELMNYRECDIIALGNFPGSMGVMVLAGTKGVNVFFDEKNDGILEVNETLLNTPFCFCRAWVGHGKIMTNLSSVHLVRKFLLSYNPCTECQNCTCTPITVKCCSNSTQPCFLPFLD